MLKIDDKEDKVSSVDFPCHLCIFGQPGNVCSKISLSICNRNRKKTGYETSFSVLYRCTGYSIGKKAIICSEMEQLGTDCLITKEKEKILVNQSIKQQINQSIRQKINRLCTQVKRLKSVH